MAEVNQAQKDGVVIGLKSIGGVVERLDIDVMLKTQPDTFNLFILALEKLQAINDPETKQPIVQDKMGYFQVAGIHGLPMTVWDGVVDHAPGVNPGKGSYCPHGTIYFPTWHRPYIAMMEQTIYAHMDEIASTFQDAKRWKAAARKFRLPYWDYYRPRGKNSVFNGVTNPRTGKTSFPYDFSIPLIFSFPEIMLYKPKSAEDKPQQTKNPLYSYKFYNGIDSTAWDMVDANDKKSNVNALNASREQTTRYPDKNRGNTSRPEVLDNVLGNAREDKVSVLLNMILTSPYNEYSSFATTQSQTDTASGSLEGLHNDYHGLIGGSGHMSRIAVAAFDPVFWMHHANIDRFLSIWQATHESWISDPKVRGAKLFPFRSSKSGLKAEFWDSDKVRTMEEFGYTYPDVAGLSSDQVLEKFHRGYSWSLHEYLRPGIDEEPPEDMKPIDVLGTYFFKLEGDLVGVLPPNNRASVGSLESPAMSAVSFMKNMAIPATEFPPKLMRNEKSQGKNDGNRAGGKSNPSGGNGSVDKNNATDRGQNSLNRATSANQQPLSDSHDDDTDAVTTNPSTEISRHIAKAPIEESDKRLLEKCPRGTHIIRQWFLDTTVERSAHNGSFTIYFFIGDFDDEPENYASQPTLAGIKHIFVAPKEICTNCALQAKDGALAHGTNSITPILLDYIGNNSTLRSLHPDDVVPFLKANLHTRVLSTSLAKLKRADMALKVSGNSSLSYVRPGSKIPKYDSGLSYPELTKNYSVS